MGINSMSFAKLLVLNSVLSLWYDSTKFVIYSTFIVSRLINSVSEIETRKIDMRNNMLFSYLFLIGICL